MDIIKGNVTDALILKQNPLIDLMINTCRSDRFKGIRSALKIVLKGIKNLLKLLAAQKNNFKLFAKIILN